MEKKRSKKKSVSKSEKLTVTHHKSENPVHLRHFLFVVGILLTIILTIARSFQLRWALNEWVLLALVFLGIIIGLFNLHKENASRFLIAVISLGLMSIADLRAFNTLISPLGTLMQVFIGYLIFFMAPAAVVVAIKEIWAYLNG